MMWINWIRCYLNGTLSIQAFYSHFWHEWWLLLVTRYSLLHGSLHTFFCSCCSHFLSFIFAERFIFYLLLPMAMLHISSFIMRSIFWCTVFYYYFHLSLQLTKRISFQFHSVGVVVVAAMAIVSMHFHRLFVISIWITLLYIALIFES